MWYLVDKVDGRVEQVEELERGGQGEIVRIGRRFGYKGRDYAKTWVICHAANSEEAWNLASKSVEMWNRI